MVMVDMVVTLVMVVMLVMVVVDMVHMVVMVVMLVMVVEGGREREPGKLAANNSCSYDKQTEVGSFELTAAV